MILYMVETESNIVGLFSSLRIASRSAVSHEFSNNVKCEITKIFIDNHSKEDLEYSIKYLKNFSKLVDERVLRFKRNETLEKLSRLSQENGEYKV